MRGITAAPPGPQKKRRWIVLENCGNIGIRGFKGVRNVDFILSRFCLPATGSEFEANLTTEKEQQHLTFPLERTSVVLELRFLLSSREASPHCFPSHMEAAVFL